MYYTVYKTTNMIDGKIYIGCHKTKNLDDGYLGSGKYLGRAIEKYGIENFEKEILAVFDKALDMFEMESELVNEDFVKSEDNYNLKLGGQGGWDYIIKNNLHKSHIDKEKHSKAGKIGGNITREKMKDLSYKKEFGKKLSLSKQKYFEKGGKGSFVGKKHTEASKKKMSESIKITSKGERNSQYGTMWITNGIDSKKIKKDGLIPEGWKKGRKIKLR